MHRKLLEEFGIDKPILIQFFEFLGRLFKGDLGTSIAFYSRKVADLVFSYLPWSFGFLIPATITSWILGNLLGALAAYKRKTATDNVLLTAFITLSQTPYYWLAMLLLYAFAVILKVFPLSGAYTPGMIPSLTLSFIIDMLHHYILPFFSIVVGAIGGWAIGMRTMVIYELKSDYVSYVDSLGLPDRKILQYVFKNSMLPPSDGFGDKPGFSFGRSINNGTRILISRHRLPHI